MTDSDLAYGIALAMVYLGLWLTLRETPRSAHGCLARDPSERGSRYILGRIIARFVLMLSRPGRRGSNRRSNRPSEWPVRP